MKAEAIGFGSAGVILNATDGQQISLAGGRRLAIRIDSQLTAGGRMSMVTEDLPPGSEIRVHLHPRSLRDYTHIGLWPISRVNLVADRTADGPSRTRRIIFIEFVSRPFAVEIRVDWCMLPTRPIGLV